MGEATVSSGVPDDAPCVLAEEYAYNKHLRSVSLIAIVYTINAFILMNTIQNRLEWNARLLDASTGADATFPWWNRSDPTVTRARTILYSIFAALLLAASTATLGRLWLHHYIWIEIYGSTVDRGRNHQRKVNALIIRHFRPVMGIPFLFLEAGIILVFYGTCDFLTPINKIALNAIASFITFCLLGSYFLIHFFLA